MPAASTRITTTTSPINPTEPRTLEPVGDCGISGCMRPALGGRELCPMHQKRRQRGQPLQPPTQERLDPFERCLQAHIELLEVDAEDDQAYDLARARFVKSIRALAWSMLKEDLGRSRWAALSRAKRRRLAREMEGE